VFVAFKLSGHTARRRPEIAHRAHKPAGRRVAPSSSVPVTTHSCCESR
jgi:hypothetical protein